MNKAVFVRFINQLFRFFEKPDNLVNVIERFVTEQGVKNKHNIMRNLSCPPLGEAHRLLRAIYSTRELMNSATKGRGGIYNKIEVLQLCERLTIAYESRQKKMLPDRIRFRNGFIFKIVNAESINCRTFPPDGDQEEIFSLELMIINNQVKPIRSFEGKAIIANQKLATEIKANFETYSCNDPTHNNHPEMVHKFTWMNIEKQQFQECLGYRDSALIKIEIKHMGNVRDAGDADGLNKQLVSTPQDCFLMFRQVNVVYADGSILQFDNHNFDFK